jgi:hypothetical protein
MSFDEFIILRFKVAIQKQMSDKSGIMLELKLELEKGIKKIPPKGGI